MSELKDLPQLPKKEGLPFREMRDSDDLIDVRMNTYGVTKADHTNPIIKTIGLGPCVAVALYEPNKKIAGLVHMTAPSVGPRWKGPHQDILNTLTSMQRNGIGFDSGSRDKMQAHIIGGWSHDDLATIARERLKQLGIENVLTDVRTEDVISHCVALDSRSGEIFRLVDILPKGMDRIDEMIAMIKTDQGAQVTSDSRTLK